MSIRAKVVSIIAAASLVAGAGLAVAAPAQANTKAKGNTKITIDAPIVAALASAGVSINAADGGKMKGRTLTFPVTRIGDGFVAHKGQLQFVRDGAVFAAGNNPLLGYPTDVPLTTATITVDVPGLGATSLFTVVNVKAAKPKVKVDKKKKTRTTISIIRGNLTVDAGQAGLINLLVGSDLLQANTPLGKTVTKIVTVAKCKNKKCTR
jgi:hypothetical protein